MTSQKKQTALITGASRGLGLALARELAGRGWKLIIDARGAEALETVRAELSQHTQVTAIAGDVRAESHRHALAAAAKKLGGLDAVINNASILGPSPQPNLLDYPLEQLEQVFQVNVLAPLAVVQAVQNYLKPGTRIINISSDAGVEAYAGWGGYGSSKAALEQLSAILAAEKPEWRIFWVDPGDMRTQMHQQAFPDEDISDRPLPEESVPGLVELLDRDRPSGRYQARQLNQPTPAGAIKELRVALTVEDFEEASQIYHDDLGLPVEESWASPEGRGLVLGARHATLELIDKAQARLIDQAEVGHRAAGQVRLAFEVSDLEKTAAALNKSKATVLNGLVDTPWGHRNLRLEDPDGMQVTLFEVSSNPATDGNNQ